MHPDKMYRIKKEYKRLYPSGRLEFWPVTFQIGMFIFWAVVALRLFSFRYGALPI